MDGVDSRCSSPNSGRSRFLSYVLLAVTLALSTIVTVHGITVGEFSYNVDESQHASSGMFYADAMRDRPHDPVAYAKRYYARYPAMSGVVHWPPFYYCVEGLFFLTFGASVVVARLSILLFSLVGLTFWFLLVRDLHDEWHAALATILLATLPTVLLFEKAVMLEIPQLTTCMAATYFWLRYLTRERSADLYATALAAAIALLTKQPAIYLALFFAISAVWIKGWRWAIRREVAWATALVVILAGPFYFVVFKLHWKSVSMDLGDHSLHGLRYWLYYLSILPHLLGWTILLLSLLGVLFSWRWNSRLAFRLMVGWFLTYGLTMTLLGHKESRFGICLLPPAIYFASGLLLRYFQMPKLRALSAAAAIFLATSSLFAAWHYQRPYVSGYANVARYITQHAKSGVILFDGPLPANFIFFMRLNDSGNHFVVLRKSLVTMRISRRAGAVELVHNTQDLQNIVDAYGVIYFVVSDGMPLEFPAQQILRDYLKTGAATEVAHFPVQGDDLPVRDTSLLVYRNTHPAKPTALNLDIRMLTLDHDISVPLKELGIGEDDSSVQP